MLFAASACFAAPSSQALLQPGRAGAAAGCAATLRAVAAQGGGSGRKKRANYWQPAARPKEMRTVVTFRAPGRAPVCFERLSKADLDEYLRVEGARGFITASGKVSRQLTDLPNGATVDLMLPEELPIETQVRLLQSTADNTTRANKQQLRAFLQLAASKEHAGSPIAVLPTEPFKDVEQRHYMQLDAALKVDNELYVGEHKSVLGEQGVDDIEIKLVKIRAALKRNSSPDLAAALHGVTHIKLFLAGEAVRAGLAVDQLVNLAVGVGASVVLPSGQALGVVGAAPAVPL